MFSLLSGREEAGAGVGSARACAAGACGEDRQVVHTAPGDDAAVYAVGAQFRVRDVQERASGRERERAGAAPVLASAIPAPVKNKCPCPISPRKCARLCSLTAAVLLSWWSSGEAYSTTTVYPSRQQERCSGLVCSPPVCSSSSFVGAREPLQRATPFALEIGAGAVPGVRDGLARSMPTRHALLQVGRRVKRSMKRRENVG